jgi:hypothetical protein
MNSNQEPREEDDRSSDYDPESEEGDPDAEA